MPSGATSEPGGDARSREVAQRGGIETVLIPSENEKDLVEIPENIKDKLDIRPVKWIDEVFEYAMEKSPIVAVVAPAPPAPAEAPKEPERRTGRRTIKPLQPH